MDIRKLQRAIVDGLEDVKGQNIVVFNTEHLSSLFERVIIASGTSNRQTKALAASVRDAVKSGGFGLPRTEGEENGEWIIVDCGAAVVHLMQPGIREYYHLEEIWGDKPVRLKLGEVASGRLVKASEPEAKPAKASAAGRAATGGKAPPTKTAAAKSAAPAARRRAPAAGAVESVPARKANAATKKAPGAATKAPARKPAAPAKKAVTRTVGTKSRAAPAAASKAPARRTTPPAKTSSNASPGTRRKP